MPDPKYVSKVNDYKGSTTSEMPVDLGDSLWAQVPENATKLAFANNGKPSGWKIEKH
jgi:hypothetical protein